LDREPESKVCDDGQTRKRKAVKRWGTDRCFFKDDLYTTTSGQSYSTEIERKFFGALDNSGPKAFKYFSDFAHPNASPNDLHELLNFISIQKLRTPKGLLSLQQQIKATNTNQVLFAMQTLQNIFCATWTECVWSIADASQSETKFVISDHPVTVYNSKCFPGSETCSEIRDPDIRLVGTHTLVPLSLNKILILTNLSWVRNPFQDPLRVRPNPRLFRQTLFNFMQIQTGRMLTEDEVRRINFIVKMRSHRYVAAAKDEWLHPEHFLSKTGWYSLSENDLLMPDPRSVNFSREMMIGYDHGATERYDEYGRRPNHINFLNQRAADYEWQTFQKAQGKFARKHGPRRRGRAYEFNRLDTEEDSPEMHKIHLGYLKKSKNRTKAPV
jgi:hypothetical protein